MIGDLERGHRQYPTPGLAEVASAPVLAWQAVVEARKAEGEGRSADAARYFEEALRRLQAGADRSPWNRQTRVAVQAGLGRVLRRDGLALDASRELAAWFAEMSPEDLNGPELADYASILDPSDPERQKLLEASVRTGSPPVWAASELLGADTDVSRRRLAWSIVRQAPQVAVHHIALAELDGASSQVAVSEFTIAAGLYVRDGDWTQAQRAAERACRADESNPVATLVLADVLRLQGDADRALELLDGLKADFGDERLLARTNTRARARALEAVGRRRDALIAIEPVLDAEGISTDHLFAARLQTSLGARETARRAFDAALALDPTDVPAVYASVVDWLRRDRLDAASDDVERALWYRPQDPNLVILLGHLAARDGEPGAPDNQIARAVAVGAEPAFAWWQLAFIRRDQGDLRGAAEALARAVGEGDEKDPDLLLEYGELLLELHDHKRAIAALRRAARLNPHSGPIHERLADALLAAGRPRDAVRVLDQALKKLGPDPLLLACRGRSHRQAGNLADAKLDLERAVSAVELDWPAAELFAVLSEAQHRQAAVVWALASLPSTRVASLAIFLWNADDREGALELAETALERSTADDPASRSQLLLVQGLGWWQLENRPDAERVLREAVALRPRDARLHVFLGLYLASTMPDEAKAEVQRARALDPGSDDIAFWAATALRTAEDDERALHELDQAIFHIGEALDLLTLRAELLLSVDARRALEVVDQVRAMGSTDERLDRVEALALVADGQSAGAVEKLRALLDESPADVELRANLAIALNAVGANREALSVLGKIAPEDMTAEILWRRAQVRRALGDRGCLEDFDAALQLEGDLAFARADLVEAAHDFGKVDLAKRHLEVLLDDPDLHDDPEVVRLLWVLDEPDSALERAERSLARDPSSARMLGLKAGILVEREEYDEAIAACRQALRLDDSSALVRYTLSLALQAVGSPAEALAVLGDGHDTMLIRQRVAVMLELGRVEEATALVKSVLTRQHEPFDDELWTALGDALIGGGVLQPVAELLSQRLAHDSSSAILRLTGSLLSEMGQFRLAVDVLEHARKRDKSIAVDGDLAWAYSNLDPARPHDVLRAVDRALRRDPNDLDLLKTKADALLQMDRKPAADRLYVRVLKELSSSVSTRGRNWVAGWCHYRLGNYDRALDHLIRAVSANTNRDGSDRFDLALVLLVAGHVARAQREYDDAVREVEAVRDPLRRPGLLQVAVIDLGEAMARASGELDISVAGEVKRMLETKLSSVSKSSLRTVRSLMKRVEAITNTPRAHSMVGSA